MYFQGIQEGEFLIFSKGLNHEGSPDAFQNFLGSCYNIQFKPYATSKMQLFQKKRGNSWKLLLTVVTENLVLNLTGLQDPTLKNTSINLDQGNKGTKYSIWHLHVQIQQKKKKEKKTLETCLSVSYIFKLKRLLLLLITLNIFRTLFYCYYVIITGFRQIMESSV